MEDQLTPEDAAGAEGAAEEPVEGTAMEGDGGKRLRNPFRSESDAFRLMVIIIASIAVIVIAAKLGGVAVGVPVALLFVAAATRATYRWLKQAFGERDDPSAAGPA